MLTNVAHFNASHCVKLWQQIRVQISAAASRAAVWNLLCIPDSSCQPQKNVPINFMFLEKFQDSHACVQIDTHVCECLCVRTRVWKPENNLNVLRHC